MNQNERHSGKAQKRRRVYGAVMSGLLLLFLGIIAAPVQTPGISSGYRWVLGLVFALCWLIIALHLVIIRHVAHGSNVTVTEMKKLN